VSAAVLGKSEGNTTSDLFERLNGKQKKNKQAGTVIEPPIDPEAAYFLFENSAILRPNVDAYVTNIDSFGHHFNPVIDLSASDADDRIADAMHYERFVRSQLDPESEVQVARPSDEEIQTRKQEIQDDARFELVRLRSFFLFSIPDISFSELRRRTRQDLEVTGNAYWEVLRNALGEIARIVYVPPMRMRLTELDTEFTEVTEHVRVTDITWVEQTRHKKFRRIVKLGSANQKTYFKEFGDMRLISRKSGKVYDSIEQMQEKEKGSLPATEILHFRIFTPNSPYGIPRWKGVIPSVLGSRELDEVNLGLFKNNTVPPLALLVGGGRLAKGVAQRIEEFIDEHLKGKKGYHRILVLEAEGQRVAGEPGPRSNPRIQFVPLRDAQASDALFQEYDKRNEEKVARSFRLPRILRGEDASINRATAFASLRFAEEQVFEPEREAFDCTLNRLLLPMLRISFWQFRSNSPVTRDPESMSEMIRAAVKDGLLLPREGRELIQDVFNRQFIEISEDWTNRPLPLTLAQIRGRPEDPVLWDGRPQPERRLEDRPTRRNPTGSTRENPPEPMRRAGTPLQPLGGPARDDDNE
jgi:PBSX family phage portal protein